VASLQQAAIAGGLKVDELVNRLRKEIGQDIFSGKAENTHYQGYNPELSIHVIP